MEIKLQIYLPEVYDGENANKENEGYAMAFRLVTCFLVTGCVTFSCCRQTTFWGKFPPGLVCSIVFGSSWLKNRG